MRSGVKPPTLATELQQWYALSEDEASALLDESRQVSRYVNRPTKKRGLSRVKAGGALLLLGLVLTSLSYAGVLATAGTGRYYIATGAILFGAFTLVRGLIEVSTARE